MTDQTPPPGTGQAPPPDSGAQTPPTHDPSGSHFGWQHGQNSQSSHSDAFDRFLNGVRGVGLARNSDDKWIAGVCSGIADRLRVDPLIVRAAFILLGLIFGAGVSLYLIAWCLLPDRRGSIMLERATRHSDGAAIGLMVVTIVVVGSGFGWLWGWGDGWGPGPIVPLLVIGGAGWLYLSRDKHQQPGAPSAPQPYAASSPAPQPYSGASPAQPYAATSSQPYATSSQPYASSPPQYAPTSTGSRTPGSANAPTFTPAGGTSPVSSEPTSSGAGGATPPSDTGVPPYQSGPWTPRPPRARRRKVGGGLTLALLGLAAAGGGATALILDQTSYDDVSGRVGIAAALGVVGLGVFIAGALGRRATFASHIGVLLALVTAVLMILPKGLSLTGSAGDETWTPTAATVASGQHYELSAGQGKLDLSRLGKPTTRTVVPAKISFGHLEVHVPAGVPVEIRTHVGIGSIDLDDSIENEIGWKSSTGGTDLNRTIRVGTQPATLVIDANVGIGQISIEKEPVR
ncbi:PspC domain-containing protein [Luteipulveratus mongoliensis]|uniref:PspC domain-containing protein n=1 Tax=Luteipulveratus mongoliensis TaxID=571913 RepID=UPI0012ED37DF|nr:PspC domain-containing protein [Luteipulveratus mongoliensis]